MSRRPAFELSDDEDDFSKQDWETEGSGITDEAVKIINQLHLNLASIKAGNSSIKLKNQVLYLLVSLVELGTIDKKQKKKLSLIIYFNDMSFDLILSSKLAKLQRNGDQNVPHDFTINSPTPIYLDSEKTIKQH